MTRDTGPQGWTIMQGGDAAMDLHLGLMVQTADEALRGLRAADEHAACRHKRSRTPPGKVNRFYPS